MNLDVPNHKESSEIISEMEEAMGVSAQTLTALRPGLNNIREKLCLASQRKTTFVEDAAYSLFRIFSVSLPVVYGERDHALGRLLARLLTSAGDTSILAWSGRSGSFNSCLPAGIAVFKQLPKTHIPLVTSSEMDQLTARLRTSSPHPPSIVNLYNRLHGLPVPSFVDNRMRLPCISFPITCVPTRSEGVFCLRTATFGDVEIRTKEDLSRLDSLILVHPWIDFLLDRRSVDNVGDTNQSTIPGSANVSQPRAVGVQSFLRGFPSGLLGVVSFASRSFVPSRNIEAHTLEFLVRLRKPFGALLLAPNRCNVAEYKRVAADSIITVQIPESTPLDRLVSNVQMLDVL